MKLSTHSVGLLLLTMVVPACGGGVPEETTTRTPQEQQPAQPAPQQLPVEVTGPGQIVGFAFEDRNRNGTFDSNDTRRAQLTVVLTNPSATQQIRSATTGTDGGFRLENLAPGEYRVTLQIPEGFERTNDDSFALTVNADGPPREVLFGIAPQKDIPSVP
jgi:SdrD B-like domain